MNIAIVVSTVGYHWEELFDAYKEFKNAGYKTDLFTIDGEPARVDPKSTERRPILSLFGLGVVPGFSPDTILGKEIIQRLKHDVSPITRMDPSSYDALFLPGGHGCLFDVNRNDYLHEKILDMYLDGKILSAVCHATSTFAFVKHNHGSIIKGRKVTGFPEKMDDLLILTKWIHPRFLPIPFSNEKQIKKAGGEMNTLMSLLNPAYHVVDLPFITGVGPKAARFVAKKVVQQLNAREAERRKAA